MQEVAINHKIIKQAMRIRMVEETFLRLFSEGKLNGTVHTCVGQEFSAIAFAGQLKKKDFVFSNHRCHGHYLAFTGDIRGLLAELLGKASGTSGGIGSSQHLCKDNFFSNGIQGGIVPVAAGFALGNKLKGTNAIGIVFIGDGTLGEGALYETMNIIAKWQIPLLIVCENNYYAQSTHQSVNLAGNILDRPAAFGLDIFHGNTWEPARLIAQAAEAIEYVRTEGKPAFFLVDTYRLNAHSKGDDDRDAQEIEAYRNKDYLNRFKVDEPGYFLRYEEMIQEEIGRMLDAIQQEQDLPVDQYFSADDKRLEDSWVPLEALPSRQVELLNGFFADKMKHDERCVFIGEDVLSPYGGAFKVARDLSFLRPDKVFSSPISEAAITGIANGLALNGFKPFVEIMFGDFITLAFDQIVNHASKFYHMFNKQITCPVVIRTPMGGRRGYGPTHSQTLDKFLIGIDNVKTVALNTFINPKLVYEDVYAEQHPVIVIENKVDYGKKIFQHKLNNFQSVRSTEKFPVVHIRPVISTPSLTIVAYGGMADVIAGIMDDIFVETDFKPELIVPTLISHLPVEFILDSCRKTGRLLVVEEGSATGGIGGELLASILERADFSLDARRITALPVPIPSVKSLENIVIPGKDRIIQEITEKFS